MYGFALSIFRKMLTRIQNQFMSLPRDTRLFLGALACFGFGGSLFDAIFNNFLNTGFQLNGMQRTILEVPRELPGLSVAFVSAILAFLPSRRMAALAGMLGFVGLLALGFFSYSFYWMMPWLFFYSLGQHMYMPISQAIGMELSKDGQAGKRLGQMSALRNGTAVAGSALVFLGFQYLHFSFVMVIFLASASLLVSGVLFYRMTPDRPHPQGAHLKMYKEYRLYYLLAILFGTRKQIFLTFAPWVLVTIFGQPTSMIARLLTIGGVIGIILQPMIGRMIDRRGERFALSLEAVVLIFVCVGYALAKDHLDAKGAFLVVVACFLTDQVLMSFNIARSTYMKKIALQPSHITPTLTLAVSMDHVFSITVALVGGLLWRQFGYQSVFFAGAGIAVVNWFVAQRMRR